MGRQLFLHHYLPAHLASTLVTGSLLEFIFNSEPVHDDVQQVTGGKAAGAKKVAAPTVPAHPKRHLTARERLAGQSMVGSWIACIIILALTAVSWWFFLPLTYGYPGLTVEQVNMRKMLGYDLHFAK